MKILLTGAGGFLGGRLAARLAASGHAVRMLVRRPEAAADLGAIGELVQGDVRDAASVAGALAGCEVAIHLAALVKRWVRDRREFDRVNVDATSALCDAAWAAGVSRVLYCSSFIALGPTDGTIGTEDMTHDGVDRNDYERTKRAADAMMRMRQARGEPIVVLYPGVVYGPGRMTDGNILAGVARDLLRGRLPGTVGPGDRKQSFSFVEDVAHGFELALEKAAPGSRYILAGENLTVRAGLALIAEAGNGEVPGRVIPYGVATALGKVLRWQAHLTGISPMMTDEEVEIYRHDWAYSSEKATRELGYAITPAREGIARMVRFLADEGYVK